MKKREEKNKLKAEKKQLIVDKERQISQLKNVDDFTPYPSHCLQDNSETIKLKINHLVE